jgi:hypothetical protein
MDISCFIDKNIVPNETELKNALRNTFALWNEIRSFVIEKYPNAKEEWNYPGVKYGWSYKIKDSKRAIIYLLPRNNYFKVAFVFGMKATEEILNNSIDEAIKNELKLAKVYAEGRGIRIDIKNKAVLKDIYELIEIKLKY